MSTKTAKTIQAQNVERRVGIGYGGTESQPRPFVHATFYKREDGAVLVAMVKGGVIELRPTDRVRVSTDPSEWANLRMCRQCPTEHPRYVSAGKTGACYCREAVNRSAAAYREVSKSGLSAAQRAAEREQKAAEEAQREVEAKMSQLMAYKPASRERMIAGVLFRNVALHGAEHPRIAELARMYGMTLEQALELAATYEPASTVLV